MADTAVKKKTLFRDGELTLRKALNVCHTAEVCNSQLDVMTKVENPVEICRIDRTPRNIRQINCQSCGTNHPPRSCPAYQKTCFKCGKKNHFASMCRSSNSNTARSARRFIQQCNVDPCPNNAKEFDDTQGYLSLTIGAVDQFTPESTMRSPITLQGTSIIAVVVDFKLDTGADANVLPLSLYNRLQLGPPDSTKTMLCTFGQHKITPIGTKLITCRSPTKVSYNLLFYII